MAYSLCGHPTVGLPALFQLTSDQFIDPNYDRFVAFCRAIKVFQKCFLHYTSFNLNAYRPKLMEYYRKMTDLYDVRTDPRTQGTPNITAIMTAIEQEVKSEPILMSVGVTQLRSKETLMFAKVVVQFGHIQNTRNQESWYLDVSSNQQSACNSTLTMRWTDLEYAVQNNRQIEITYTDYIDINLNVERMWQPFNISYRQLHHEGFHQYIQFGKTRILFCIEFSSNEQNYNELIVNNFHLHSIIYALKRRINHFRAQPSNQQNYRHRDADYTRRVTYDIEQVDPTTTDAFWGQTPDVTQNRTTVFRVKYTDLQIGFQLGEELTHQKLCTCNEFCNMNAFFHYNPIYRFLLVEHNRHYIKNKTIVSNLYQMAITFTATPTPNVGIQLTPVFDWFNSVSERLTENHLIFYKKPVLKTQWNNSTPSAIDMEGYVYISWFTLNLTDIMHTTYGQVNFDEQAFINLENIMDRLYELHRRIECYTKFVNNTRHQRKQWIREFEYRSRNYYFEYLLRKSLVQTVTQFNTTYEEKLFTTDHEVRAIPISNAQRGQYYRWRKIEHNSFPQNITFLLKCFPYAINQLWFSLTRFEPMSGLHTRTALKQQYDIFKSIQDFNSQSLTILQGVHGHRIQLEPTSLQALQGQGFSLNTQNIFIEFYKLKLYSRIFKIQNKFLDSLFRYTEESGTYEQGFTTFEGIWNDNWIEDTTSSTGQPQIFQKNQTFIILINEFYNNIWLPLSHQQYGQLATDQQIIDSMFDEFAKRRVWDRIDGENRQIFYNIIESFDESLRQLVTQSNDFIDNHIMLAMNDIRDYHRNRESASYEDDKLYCMILDVVMYWLFRATLYQITGTVAALLRTIDGLHSNDLVIANTQYFLSKPCLVKFFLTRDLVLRKVDELYTRSIVYSSPFDNMGEAVRQTQYNIKMLYKELFRKLVDDWFDELEWFIHNSSTNWYTMVYLHVIAGASFIISYVNHSREGVQDMRKKLTHLRGQQQYSNIPTHRRFQRVWDLCLNWFQNIDAIELRHPFAINRWAPILDQVFNLMDARHSTQTWETKAGPIIQPNP